VWISQVVYEQMDRELREVIIPGTHDGNIVLLGGNTYKAPSPQVLRRAGVESAGPAGAILQLRQQAQQQMTLTADTAAGAEGETADTDDWPRMDKMASRDDDCRD
jgi:hypothetical protein